jgi:hypothetical protein
VREKVFIGATTKLPFLHCPACGKKIDAATGVSLEDESARPHSGAFTICRFCATLLVFEESFASVCALSLRCASAVEVEACKRRNPKIAALMSKLQQAVRELVLTGKGKGQG